MTNRYLCIHGHFYQPPRENPWLEEIDYQDSARPYHDWNERISAECYRSNGLSRILDHDGWVVRLSNNYSRMSFNFGPTLLSWMEKHDPLAYGAILEGDRKSLSRFGGHGSAIAQAYNHMIMPLANRRDKVTQVKWGLRDFESRFGREAESMWLPETAVDLETLEILADHGMKYVILAPRQAQAVRPLEGNNLWESVRGERVDPRKPYAVRLSGGKTIAVFFYNGELSRAVAFEGLLNNGDVFANRLCSGFDHVSHSQLMHIATDGESYGHHHLKGDMALAYALDQVEKRSLATLTNYGQYLELFPPTEEATIFEYSSWSCIHGIERWRRDCGCNSGGRPQWNQAWREPVREAMDYLRDQLLPCYETIMSAYTDDCWGMRDDYIRVIQNRDGGNRKDFLQKWTKQDLNHKAEVAIFRMLEMQRNLQLMYTSCAWFFDEISGVETVQSLAYAARAIELAEELCPDDVQDEFMHILQKASSNLPEYSNGRLVFDLLVWPSKMDFLKVGAHLGVKALFESRKSDTIFACFDSHWVDMRRLYSGRSQLIIAHCRITSRVTREEREMELVALHLGDHNINVGVLPFGDQKSFEAMAGEFTDAFGGGDIARSLRLLDKYFEGNIYYLNDLFREQQREVIDRVFAQTLESLEEQFNEIYDRYYTVMSYISKIQINLPQVFLHIAHFVQNKHISKQLGADNVNLEEIQRYLEEARNWGIELDKERLQKLYIEMLVSSFEQCRKSPSDIDCMRTLQNRVQLKDDFPFAIDLAQIQNSFASWIYKSDSQPDSAEWREVAAQIADLLKVRI